MYEMATMQNEVNTHEMVVKVKGLLAENNIAQKVFNETAKKANNVSVMIYVVIFLSRCLDEWSLACPKAQSVRS